MKREDLRNIAIIAHVDHGKTTLVDKMLKESGIFRDNQKVADRVMDSGDIEKERGITILAKNTSVRYGDVKINIIDTPGHADFGGEVERILGMVNGVILLVDAAEGPMPQTRFVMQKALELKLKVIICINKIDRPDSRVSEVEDEILELLLDLNADESQLDSPIVYCSARDGWASLNRDTRGKSLKPLFDTIIEYIPTFEGKDGGLQLLVSAIDYNDYVGRVGIGRIERGSIEANTEVVICRHGKEGVIRGKLANLYAIEGLVREPVKEAKAGDIVCFSGFEIDIGDTVCQPDCIDPLPFNKISEPTVEMTFMVNDSPFAGKEGKFVTTRHLKDRLSKEVKKDVSLKVEQLSPDEYRVLGRGEMHLAILIETMRRAGYEFQVGAPKVLFKREEDGSISEPYEMMTVDVPEIYAGSVYRSMGERKGELVSSRVVGDRLRLKFELPSRGLFGYKSQFLTDTHGEGVLNTVFSEYKPYAGEISKRQTGSLVAFETGEAVTYGLFNAQDRGVLFVGAGEMVYEGMVVGVSPKPQDITVNVCKKKHVTNMRASGSDDAMRLENPKRLSIEEALEFIKDDELLEVTPLNIRIRKKELKAKHGFHAKK